MDNTIFNLNSRIYWPKLYYIDLYLSKKIFNFSAGKTEYLILLGASLFGHKFMPLVIFVSIYILGLNEGLFLAFCSIFTVLLTQIGKYSFERSRPNPSLLNGTRLFYIRENFQNPSFPSGDSAQSACFSMACFFLKGWWTCILIIPWTMFSRIYY